MQVSWTRVACSQDVNRSYSQQLCPAARVLMISLTLLTSCSHKLASLRWTPVFSCIFIIILNNFPCSISLIFFIMCNIFKRSWWTLKLIHVFLQGLQSMETSTLGLTQISRENVNILFINQFKNVLSYYQWKEGFIFFFNYGIFCICSCVCRCICGCAYVWRPQVNSGSLYQLLYIFIIIIFACICV